MLCVLKMDEKETRPDMRDDFRHAVLNDGVGVDDTVKQVLVV